MVQRNDERAPMSDRPTRVRYRMFALAAGASWLMYLHRYAWSVVRPSIQQAIPGLSDTRMGWLDSAFAGAYAVGQVPVGWAGDRFGQRRVLTTIIAAWSVVVALTGFVGSFAALVAARVGLGLATAGTYPNLSQVTRHWFPPTVRTLVQGAVASLAGRAGGACASLVVASLLMAGLGLDWRQSLWAISLLGGMLTWAYLIDFRNTPREHPHVNEAERREIERPVHDTSGPAATADCAAGVTAAAASTAVFRLDLRPDRVFTLGMLLTQTFLVTFADNLFAFWLPTYLVQAKQFGQAEMGIFASLPLWGGALGGLCGGGLNDLITRLTGSRRWGRSLVGATGQLASAALLPLATQIDDGRAVMLVLLAAKFFVDWSQPTVWGAVTDMAGRASGTVFGLANMTGSIGAFAAGPLMGALKERYGFDALFWLVSATYVLAAATWLVIDCTRRVVVEEG